MTWRTTFGWLMAALPIVAGCSDSRPLAAADDDGNATELIEPADLQKSGFGRLRFRARDGNILDAQIYRATRFNPMTGPVWFVMHGVTRDVDRYIRTAAPAAERYDALAIVIHFSKDAYPSSSDYTLGVVTEGRAVGTALARGRWRDPEHYLYAELDYLFDEIRQSYGGAQAGYYIYGHSAGAQFAHRLATFRPESRVLGIAAANAGWYTLPIDEPRAEFTIPYGLYGSPVRSESVERLLATPLGILVGENDTENASESRLVRSTPEAMAQGGNRFERGLHYFETGEAIARERGAAMNWRIDVVPQAGHSAAQMADSAASILFSDSPRCKPSTVEHAAGIEIHEILADPPDGSAGDANGDGGRDPQEDEFVEIVNSGSASVCLQGWTLGDASNPARQVFPLGTRLDPDEVLVVFGGGVPTGAFHGSQVLTARYDGRLSLTNDGDVVTLRDHTGATLAEVSWGDCATQPCAADHIEGGLGFEASVTRIADSGWRPHEGAPYSPGRRNDAPAN